MKTLVSSGMAPISDDGCKIWRFDKNDSQSDKIKKSLDLHFTATTTTPTATTTTPSAITPTTTASATTASTTTSSTAPASTTTTSTTTTSTTAASTTTPPTETTQTASTPTTSSKTASPPRKAITENDQTATSFVETTSKNDGDKNEDSDDDEVIFRRPGWKRKRPKFELESLSTTKKIKMTEGNYEIKRTNFEVKPSQSTDKTYTCKVFKCGKIFTCRAQFNQHLDNHSCKYCYKFFKTPSGCADHSKTCAERHKPGPRLPERHKPGTRLPECMTTTVQATTSTTTASPGSNATTDSPKQKSNSVETIKENILNVAERPSEHVDGDDDDVVIIRRPGGKRKQPKFEQEMALKTKKKNKFDWILSNDETYECKMPQCGKIFTSWTHFDKHQNDHRTQCKDCYKIFSNRKGLETHLYDCSERHKPKPRVYECQICYKEFITETKLKDHVDGAHQKKEFVDLAENLQSKIAECKRRKERKRKNKLRRKRRGTALNKSPPKESVAIENSPEPLAEVIEISDDEDGEVVCKPGCDCVVCKGIGKYFCK